MIYTNIIAPSVSQRQQILELIVEGEADLVRIDKEIACAQAVLDELVVKKRNRLEQIHAYHVALCPAQRLPHELVADILLLARRPWNSSLPLSQICRAWRQVAIKSPRLWTKLKVVMRSSTFDNKMSLIKMFCERISGLNLSTRIESSGFESFDTPKLVQALTPYLNNIDSLHLLLPEDSFLAFANLPVDSLSSLTCFYFSEYLSEYSESISLIPTPDLISFASARRLSQFNFLGSLPTRTVLQLPEQLAELVLSGLTAGQCIGVLQYTPNVMSLSCTIINSEIEGQSPHNQAISMLQLHELNLVMNCENEGVDIGHIVNHIIAPSLQTFELDANFDTSIWSISSFRSLITRSSCSPTRLSLKRVDMSSLELLQCISLLPSLEELDLEYARFVDDLLLEQLLYQPERRSNVLPELTVLNVWTSRSREIYSLQLFMDVVKSRYWPDDHRGSIARLTHCRLRLEEFESDFKDIELQVGILRGGGLDITITSSNAYAKVRPSV